MYVDRGMILRRLVGICGVGALCVVAFAVASGPATGQTRGHSSFGRHDLNGFTAGDESVCTFCHTPRGARQGAPDWSAAQGNGPYTTYDSIRTDGGAVPGSISIACLSCHDGTQALDVLPVFASATGGAPPPRIAQPGDREHPVGIVYSGFVRASSSFARKSLRREMIGSETRWWLDLEPVPDGVRDKTDVIFYTRMHEGREKPFIECTTCHDPHANPGRRFLRAPAAGSALCYACHTV